MKIERLCIIWNMVKFEDPVNSVVRENTNSRRIIGSTSCIVFYRTFLGRE